jgi:hypothetical protein
MGGGNAAKNRRAAPQTIGPPLLSVDSSSFSADFWHCPAPSEATATQRLGSSARATGPNTESLHALNRSASHCIVSPSLDSATAPAASRHARGMKAISRRLIAAMPPASDSSLSISWSTKGYHTPSPRGRFHRGFSHPKISRSIYPPKIAKNQTIEFKPLITISLICFKNWSSRQDTSSLKAPENSRL